MAEADSLIHLVVGLGNPGAGYDGTRHNVGFDVIDRLADDARVRADRKKFSSLMCEYRHGDSKVILLKPQQYMNRSGQAVATVKGFYKLSLPRILIVTDDMALPPGQIRLRARGSAGGHNGLKDIIEKLGTNEFCRLRVGVGASGRQDSADYVLSRPSGEDREAIAQAVNKAVEAVQCWIDYDMQTAMNRYNVKNMNQ